MRSNGHLTLTGQLKKTVFLLGAAMIAMWSFFFFGIRSLIKGYTLSNLEQAALSGITQLNTSFLQMEQMDLAMMQEELVAALFEEGTNLDFHNAAAAADDRLQELIRGKKFISSMIIYRDDGCFYRLRGTISNTGVERLMHLMDMQSEDYIFTKLDNENYIGYITRPVSGGGIVMLMKETDIRRLLKQSSQNGMQFVLTAGDEIAVSDGELPQGTTLAEFCSRAEHIETANVGYTPFRLWVSYTEADAKINALFFAAMALMTLILVFIMQAFLHFWRVKFFVPIQTVIDEVESFESGKGRLLPLAGPEHFDGLIRGINDLVMRIETKDRALIVSLKKQINAHFIFNSLNIIKALAEKGESEKAGELCNGLSTLLRYANEGESFISGMEEFFMLENYVGIMQTRYPNRFTAEIDMEDFLEDAELPRMLLQPIVENSIVHGLIGAGRKGHIHVYARPDGENVSYIVEDDGCGMTKEALDKLLGELRQAPVTEPEIEGIAHVALINIERRIKSYFGKSYGLFITSAEGEGTTVVMTLPGKSVFR